MRRVFAFLVMGVGEIEVSGANESGNATLTMGWIRGSKSLVYEVVPVLKVAGEAYLCPPRQSTKE